MGTESFDNGSFWLIMDTSMTLKWLAVLGLSVVGLGYVSLLLKLVFIKPHRIQQATASFQVRDVVESMKHSVEMAATSRSRCRVLSLAAKFVAKFIQNDSPTRKMASVWIKLADLAIETVLLFQILEAGAPAVLVALFTTIVAMNAISCAVMMFVPCERLGIAEVLVDILFDFLIAVGYPTLVILYCISNFNFDRAKFAINLAVFPAGWFEHQASIIADPVQTAVKLKMAPDHVHNGLLHSSRSEPRLLLPILQRGGDDHEFPRTTDLRIPEASPDFSRLVGVFCRVFTHFRGGKHANVGDRVLKASGCPCLTLIDGDIAPKTYVEWLQPKNVTDKVAQLATMGTLEALQLTNRYLPELPEELRGCKELSHISLVYTHTKIMPTWTKEFTKLQYLHIEGTTFSSLQSLPDDMFDDMAALTFMHLGVHKQMTRLPSFRGLTRLKSLTLALLFALIELPSFESLQHLERLVLVSLLTMESLPDFAPVKELKSFIGTDRGAWCCNGFIDTCDLQDVMCGLHPLWGAPAVSCTKKRAATATLAVTKKFAATICDGVIMPGVVEGSPTEAGMEQCNGTLYRQCEELGYGEAICYNARFMGIACSTSPFPVEMRRRQIEQGGACDPEYEAWLGCK